MATYINIDDDFPSILCELLDAWMGHNVFRDVVREQKQIRSTFGGSSVLSQNEVIFN